jgi:hypothetical protein
MTAPSEFTARALPLFRAGYRVVPIPLGGKRVALEGWSGWADTQDEKQVKKLVATANGCGVGILAKWTPGVDVDVRHGELAQVLAGVAHEVLGWAPERIGMPPKLLLPYRTEHPFKKLLLEFKLPEDQPGDKVHKVEILCDGQQWVAYHTHPDTGRLYLWPEGDLPPRAALPEITEELAREFLQQCRGLIEQEFGGVIVGEPAHAREEARPNSEQRGEIGEVASALRAIPNRDDYEQWIRVGLALKGALGEAAWPLFARWSAFSPRDDPVETAKKWRSFKPEQIGAGTIFHIAREHGWERETRKAEQREEKSKSQTWALPPLTPAAWLARDLPPEDLLLGHLLSTTSRAMLAADTGLGKTMLGLAIATAVCLGCEFMHWAGGGKPRRVLVIDGEMPRELMRSRIADAHRWFGIDPMIDGLFLLSLEDVREMAEKGLLPEMPPLDTPEGHEWVYQFIELIGGVDFVVLDNVQALTVGDLREETTWAPLNPLVYGLTRRHIGQLWLHHVGHDKSRAYGSKRFQWIMDAVMLGEAPAEDEEAEPVDVAMKVTFQKARRRTPDSRADFEPVTLQLDKGRWESKGTGPTKRKSDKPRRPSDAGELVIKAVKLALKNTPMPPPASAAMEGVKEVTAESQVRFYYYQQANWARLDKAEKETVRKTLRRGLDNAKAARRIGQWEEWIWIVGRG